MKILIACEYSGKVREAFAKKGHDVTSCDILPSDLPGKHYQGDVMDIISEGWDMLIGFPPCTYLSSAGLFRCNIKMYGQKAIERIKNRNKAIEFFLDLYSAPIDKICLENPLGHISSSIIEPSQIVHPYFFGEKEMKRTALWLKNLPPLIHHKEDNLFGFKTHSDKPDPLHIDSSTGKKRYFTDSFVNGSIKDAHSRNKTFSSIASAMADQWG